MAVPQELAQAVAEPFPKLRHDQMSQKVSYLFSSFNEQATDFLFRNLELLVEDTSNELIVVDGGSTDGTIERLSGFSEVKVFSLSNSNRAQRYNFALSRASGRILVIVHPRSLLPQNVNSILQGLTLSEKCVYAFSHCFDENNLLLRFTSWYSNRVRGDLKSIFYLDHCWVFTRAITERLGRPFLPEVDIFEDTLFCLKVKKSDFFLKRLSARVTTSAIRFRKNGYIKQSVLNQLLKLQFIFSFRPKRMNQNYERDLNLN